MEELDKVIDKYLDEAYFIQNQYGSETTYDRDTVRKMLKQHGDNCIDKVVSKLQLLVDGKPNINEMDGNDVFAIGAYNTYYTDTYVTINKEEILEIKNETN